MSMPFYVSPEQLMKDKADYARKGIARGRSVVVLGYDKGIAFVAENPQSLRKISEIYDRIAFAAVGMYYEFENLRVAGIRYADLRGYSYDRSDVSARGLANAYAQTLGTVFTQEPKPYEIELVVAEVGEDEDHDQIYRLTYDGSVADQHGYVVMGGTIAQAEELLQSRWRPGLSLGEALSLAVEALALDPAGGPSRELEPGQLEVAVLDRSVAAHVPPDRRGAAARPARLGQPGARRPADRRPSRAPRPAHRGAGAGGGARRAGRRRPEHPGDVPPGQPRGPRGRAAPPRAGRRHARRLTRPRTAGRATPPPDRWGRRSSVGSRRAQRVRAGSPSWAASSCGSGCGCGSGVPSPSVAASWPVVDGSSDGPGVAGGSGSGSSGACWAMAAPPRVASICRTLASWALMLSRRAVAAASSRSDSVRTRAACSRATATSRSPRRGPGRAATAPRRGPARGPSPTPAPGSRPAPAPR